MTMKTHTKQRGFSLVEVALALMVVAVGIMGSFSLFPAGLEAGRKSSFETRASIFADDVFAYFRTMSTVTNWNLLVNLEAPAPGDGIWDTPVNLQVAGDNVVRPNVYKYIAPASVGNIDEYSFRCRLNMVASGTNRYAMTLHIWKGSIGATAADADALKFYSELYKHGMQP